MLKSKARYAAAFLLAVIVMLAAAPVLNAQDGGEDEGSDVFTVEDMAFESYYPDGFSLTVRAESAEGDIENVACSFWHTPTSKMSGGADYDPDEDVWIYRWEPKAGSSHPAWVKLDYECTLTDSEGNKFKTERVDQRYEDNNLHDWKVAENDKAVIYYYNQPDEFGETLLEGATEGIKKIEEAFGQEFEYRPLAVIYNDLEGFEEWIVSERSDNIIGLSLASEGYTVQRLYGGYPVEDLAYGTIPHEFGHFMQNQAAGWFSRGWFIEGNATFMELYQQYDYLERVRNLAANDQLPTLQGTGPGPGSRGPDGRNRYGYDVGYTFFVFLEEKYGLDVHAEIWDILAKKVPLDDALEIATGSTFVELENEWRVWLGSDTPAPTIQPTPTLAIFARPTPTYASPGSSD